MTNKALAIYFVSKNLCFFFLFPNYMQQNDHFSAKKEHKTPQYQFAKNSLFFLSFHSSNITINPLLILFPIQSLSQLCLNNQCNYINVKKIRLFRFIVIKTGHRKRIYRLVCQYFVVKSSTYFSFLLQIAKSLTNSLLLSQKFTFTTKMPIW